MLQGIASRHYLGFSVHDAQFFLPRRATTPSGAADRCEIPHPLPARRGAVALADVPRAWDASLGVLEPVFDAWLRPLGDGDGERFVFPTQGARLEGPGRPPARLAPGWGSLALRATWLGPQAPAALLRGWFPGA